MRRRIPVTLGIGGKVIGFAMLDTDGRTAMVFFDKEHEPRTQVNALSIYVEGA